MDQPVVVAGNGRSIMNLKPGRVLASDFIIRINNFFFEPKFFLGRRVDMAFMGGDPRVAPFMFETLHGCRRDYDLRAWTSHNPKVVKAGQRRFGALFQSMKFRDDEIEVEIGKLISQYNRVPTTGIYAVLMAHGMGAKDIILAGMDFYSGSRRYPYQPGPHYRDLMGQDLGRRGLDHQIHDPELDKAILRMILARGDAKLLLATESKMLTELIDPAPVRVGSSLLKERTTAPVDWAKRSGFYPIQLLKTLRRSSTFLRSLRKHF
ncbi:MAG: hypothetical protein ACU0BN_13750 [Sulfitobacter sp.]